ncbi:MAG: SGNH/GDSL hydrolase family protein [Clostridia bacterium]|nr:SGNH/GDSL hydrolase family protein [Clostridia bacterium]
MKKILLIGDSIRMGYDHYVQESMANVAKVYFPKENCSHTTAILRMIHCWTDDLKLYEADAVHFNAGLWDTVRIYGEDTLLRPETYAYNLERIVKRIHFLFPNAKVIFATSTPVQEEGYIDAFETRYNSDVEAFNQIACEVLPKHGVLINDLYHLMKGVPADYYSDQTHFYTAAATERLGKQVARTLCQALDIDESLLLTPDSAKYHCPMRGIPDKEAYVQQGHIYVRKESYR